MTQRDRWGTLKLFLGTKDGPPVQGDLYVNIRVVVPTKLTREQRKLFEQLGATLPVENQPAQPVSTLFDKVKDIFG